MASNRIMRIDHENKNTAIWQLKNTYYMATKNYLLQYDNQNYLLQYGNQNDLLQYGNQNCLLQYGNQNYLLQYGNSNVVDGWPPSDDHVCCWLLHVTRSRQW